MVNTNDTRGTRFCVTINTHDDDPDGVDLQQSIDRIERMFEEGHVVYAVGSWERGGATDRLHIQAWILLKRQSRIGWFTSQVPQSYAEVQRAKDDDKACLYACNPAKEGWIGKAFEFGERPAKGAGRRTDLDSMNGAIANGDVLTYRQVNDLNPSIAARHPNWVNWRLEEAARDELLTRPRYADVYAPKVWQHWLWRYLTELPPDERKVIFIVDKLGHAGKTRFCREFKRSSGLRVQSLRPGRAADMADSLEIRTEVIFIDVPRSRNDYIGHVYSFMEEAKDGEVFSPKFHSRYKPLPACHIVMFTNSDVDTGMRGQGRIVDRFAPGGFHDENPRGAPLSHDRYAIWELTPNHNEPWTGHSVRWGEDCPPFQSFNSDMAIVPYHPPFVPTSGTEFSGDEAGDGPFPSNWDDDVYDSQDPFANLVIRNGFVPIMTIVGHDMSPFEYHEFVDRYRNDPLNMDDYGVFDNWYSVDIDPHTIYSMYPYVPIGVEHHVNNMVRQFRSMEDWEDFLNERDIWDDLRPIDVLLNLPGDNGDIFDVRVDVSLADTTRLPRSHTHIHDLYAHGNASTLIVNHVYISAPAPEEEDQEDIEWELPDLPEHAPAA